MPKPRNPAHDPLDVDTLAALLDTQDGVVTRGQLHAVAATDIDIARMVRRRELVRVARAVFVNHTGSLTPAQREWAAVLSTPGSALADESALEAARRKPAGRGAPQPDSSGQAIHLAVPSHAHPAPRPGVVVHHVAGLAERVRWNARPPRMTVEVAAVRVAGAAASEADVIGLLSQVVGDRLTTVARLRTALAATPKVRRHAWMVAVLDDLATGVGSVLEHGYLVRVERAHGLPQPDRQAVRSTPTGREYRDVEYVDFRVVVELNGKAGHDSSAARERDYERDLDDHVAGKEAIKLSWGQVFRHSCRTAAKVGTVLRRNGWEGTPVPCGDDCRLAA